MKFVVDSQQCNKWAVVDTIFNCKIFANHCNWSPSELCVNKQCTAFVFAKYASFFNEPVHNDIKIHSTNKNDNFFPFRLHCVLNNITQNNERKKIEKNLIILLVFVKFVKLISSFFVLFFFVYYIIIAYLARSFFFSVHIIDSA